jgi:hypothetical protein
MSTAATRKTDLKFFLLARTEHQINIFATFHRLLFIHSPGTRGLMIMEEEVNGPSREKGSMMNYTKTVKGDRKKSPPTFNQELLKIYQLRRKKESGREMDVCVIACWSRIGSEHTNTLMSSNYSDTDDDDHNIVDNTNNLVGNLTNQSAASVVYSYSGNGYWNVKKE